METLKAYKLVVALVAALMAAVAAFGVAYGLRDQDSPELIEIVVDTDALKAEDQVPASTAQPALPEALPVEVKPATPVEQTPAPEANHPESH